MPSNKERLEQLLKKCFDELERGHRPNPVIISETIIAANLLAPESQTLDLTKHDWETYMEHTVTGMVFVEAIKAQLPDVKIVMSKESPNA